MKILIINCSPVRNGATAEIVNIVRDNVSEGNEVRSICIDDYEIALCKGCRACLNVKELLALLNIFMDI